MKYHFDIKGILENFDAFKEGLEKRNSPVFSSDIMNLSERRSKAIQSLERTRSQIKELSQVIGREMKSGGQNFKKIDELKSLVGTLKSDESYWEMRLAESEEQLEEILISLPNLPDPSVPFGTSEADNQLISTWGRTFDRPLPHYDLPLNWGFETAAKISGSRFSALSGGLARLHRALGQFMLDHHISRGFMEVIPPVLVKGDSLAHTGQLPKFADDLFRAQDDKWLIPTAEVSLTNMFAGEILEATHRVVALTDCFRREAGSAGRDTRGMIRQHQFQKVELVTLTDPQNSAHEHEFMLESAELILQKLELPYRVMLLCSGDMGFSSQKTYDIEVWLAGEKSYREISSVSNCGDFQSRRMNTRYRADKKSVYAHSLNGSGLAVGRTLVAVVEAYQSGNDVVIPKILRPYLGGEEFLSGLNKTHQ